MANVRTLKINPDQALRFIVTNESNRIVNKVRVAKYAQEMKNGQWRTNGDTIKISRDGVLMDGQHRMHAVIESDLTVEFLVVDNLEGDALPTIDTGMPRKSNQVLQMRGEKHAVVLNSIIRSVCKIRSDNQMSTPYLSTQEIIDLTESLVGIRETVLEVVKFAKQALCPPSLIGAVYYEAKLRDKSLAKTFLHQIVTGLDIVKGSPTFLLRERLIKNCKSKLKMTLNDVLALHIKAWNALRTGEEIQSLTWSPRHHRFPVME